MNNILKHTIAKNILLLQGPVGYFFSDLYLHLKKCGAINVVKINFNAGDDFFYTHKPTLHFNQPFHQLENFYKDVIDTHHIEAVYLFGDCRFVHKTAIDILKKHNILKPKKHCYSQAGPSAGHYNAL